MNLRRDFEASKIKSGQRKEDYEVERRNVLCARLDSKNFMELPLPYLFIVLLQNDYGIEIS